MTQAATAAPKSPALSEAAQAVVAMQTSVGNLAEQFRRTLPPSVPAEKFVRTVQTAITMNPEIAACTRQSVINACMKAASDGLILDGREATLTCFNTKVKRNGVESWEKQAAYIPMVTGIFKRVRNSGEISRLNAFVRHENDFFKRTLGLEPTLIHEPNDDSPGRAIGVYAVCLFKDGAVDYEYMTAEQVLKIGRRTKNAEQYDPEKGQNYEEWWRKCVVRRLSKRLPMSSDLQNVIQRVDELYEPDPSLDGVDPITGELPGAAGAEPEKPKRKYTRKAPAAGEEGPEGNGTLPLDNVIDNPPQNASNAAPRQPAQQKPAAPVTEAHYTESGEREPGSDDGEYEDVI